MSCTSGTECFQFSCTLPTHVCEDITTISNMGKAFTINCIITFTSIDVTQPHLDVSVYLLGLFLLLCYLCSQRLYLFL